jgi:hypothetical protein
MTTSQQVIFGDTNGFVEITPLGSPFKDIVATAFATYAIRR